jgi:hypothetical protein
MRGLLDVAELGAMGAMLSRSIRIDFIQSSLVDRESMLAGQHAFGADHWTGTSQVWDWPRKHGTHLFVCENSTRCAQHAFGPRGEQLRSKSQTAPKAWHPPRLSVKMVANCLPMNTTPTSWSGINSLAIHSIEAPA